MVENRQRLLRGRLCFGIAAGTQKTIGKAKLQDRDVRMTRHQTTVPEFGFLDQLLKHADRLIVLALVGVEHCDGGSIREYTGIVDICRRKQIGRLACLGFAACIAACDAIELRNRIQIDCQADAGRRVGELSPCGLRFRQKGVGLIVASFFKGCHSEIGSLDGDLRTGRFGRSAVGGAKIEPKFLGLGKTVRRRWIVGFFGAGEQPDHGGIVCGGRCLRTG